MFEVKVKSDYLNKPFLTYYSLEIQITKVFAWAGKTETRHDLHISFNHERVSQSPIQNVFMMLFKQDLHSVKISLIQVFDGVTQPYSKCVYDAIKTYLHIFKISLIQARGFVRKPCFKWVKNAIKI